MVQRALLSIRLLTAMLAGLALGLSGCSPASPTASTGGSPTATSDATASSTAGQASPCLQLIPTATLANGVNGVPGIQLPTGTYISLATALGAGAGRYAVQSYELCFQGQESAIDRASGSTISGLVQAGWELNNLFPDPTSMAYLDPCSGAFTCVNTSGTPDPFTFLGVDEFTIPSPGYTAFQLQVATITAPSCLDDPNYYSGIPQYTIFEDGPNTGGSNPIYHFQMPPGTRNSAFRGGGTAGSTYTYFCSAGTAASVSSFLEQSMRNDGYTVGGVDSGGCFEGHKGTSPTYGVQVCVTSPNNYYVRIFVPL